jgi:enoyl-CoA hydratase
MTTAHDLSLDTVTLERDGHVLVMSLNRPDKRNAFNLAMIADLSRAYALLEADDSLRAGVLVARGDHFTAGLDLVDVGPAIAAGKDPFPEGGRDPWRLDGAWTKPVVAAAQGRCLTLGIELLLAADIRIAAADTRRTSPRHRDRAPDRRPGRAPRRCSDARVRAPGPHRG